MENLSPRNIGLTVLSMAALASLLFVFVPAASAPEAGELVDQARQAMTEAHSATCQKVGYYLDLCFSQGLACDKIDPALAYHDATFGGDWLTACRPTKG